MLCFLFVNTLHFKTIIWLQSVIGHSTEKPSPCHRGKGRIRTWKIRVAA